MRSGRLSTHAALIAAAALMVVPFVWEFLTSLKSEGNATRVPPTVVPDGRWDNFSAVFRLVPFGRQFLNTVLMTAGRTAGQVLLCSLAAYAFARLRFPGRKVIFGVMLSVLMVPPQLFLIPQYQIMADL